MHARSLHGNREISSLTAGGGMRRRPAAGRRGAEADDVRAGEVTLTGSTDEVGEQDGLARCGVDGGKRWDRAECGTAKHGPDSAPAQLCPKRTPAYVGPLTSARRHLLAIRTVCGNSARTDLCGGCPVMGIPTAILGRFATFGDGCSRASCRRSLQSPKFPDSGQSGANSTRVGHAQPVPAIVTEAAQRLDIPLVDGARIGKCGHGAIDAGLAQ